MRHGQQMKKLMEARDQILAEIRALDDRRGALQTKLEGLEFAMRTINGGADPFAEGRPQRGVKRAVLEIVNAAGSVGVTATEVMERAAKNGKALEKGSVSSLLSRLKSDGILTFDGEKYRPASPNGQGKPPLTVVKTA